MRQVLGLLVLVAASAGCTHRGPSGQVPVGARPAAYLDPMGFRTSHPRRLESATLQLPSASAPELVRYEVIDGMAVMEGDILLGPADGVARQYAPDASSRVGFMPVKDQRSLWPRGEIPYEIDASLAPELRPDIDWAAGELAAVGLTVRPRTAQDADYVVFRDGGNGCNAHLGRKGGSQPINLQPNCRKGAVLHELMHAAGVEHEHVRSDRDAYVTIVWEEIADEMRFAFEKASGRARDSGPYDYASIMHYGPTAFSKRGNPTVVTHQSGVEIGQLRGLSSLDAMGLRTLYPNAGPPRGGFPQLPGFGGGALPPGFPQLPQGFPQPQALPQGSPQPPGGFLGLPIGDAAGGLLPPGFGNATPAGLPAGFPAALPQLPTL